MCPRRGAAPPGRRTAPRRSAPRVARDRRRAPAAPCRARGRWTIAELGDVGRRRRPEPLEVAPRQHPHRLLGDVRVGHGRLAAGRDERPPGAERPRPAAGNVEQRGVLPKRPPRPLHGWRADPLLEPRLALRDGARLGEVVDELGITRRRRRGSARWRRTGGRAAGPRAASVPSPRGTPDSRRRATACRVTRISVALTTSPVAKARVEVGRVEVADPVPQGDVRRGRLLGLEGDDAAYRVGHAATARGAAATGGRGSPG